MSQTWNRRNPVTKIVKDTLKKNVINVKYTFIMEV
jgi:hypothetical protein